MKRFCVLTTGRTGSQSLMLTLGGHSDIKIPEGEGINAELVNEQFEARHIQHYQDLVQRPIRTKGELIDAFYDATATAPFAGFKLMPAQYPDFDDFVRRQDIQFIVLTRQDIASTLASRFIADRFRSWSEPTRKVVKHITFGTKHVPSLRTNIAKLVDSLRSLARVEQAIRLEYEDLCQPGFASADLNRYFGRDIAFPDPRGPTDARHYVTNWDDYFRFVQHEVARLSG